MRLIIYALFGFFLLSGCSTKIYHAASVAFNVKDAQTQEPVKNASFDVNSQDVQSDENGKLVFNGEYDRRWHMYPFPIISHGSLNYAVYIIKHPNYSSYELSCTYLSMVGECFDINIVKVDQNKKELLFECDGCTVQK